MNSDLEEFYHSTFLPSLSSRTVDENWSLFRDEITLLVDKYVPEIAISNVRETHGLTNICEL